MSTTRLGTVSLLLISLGCAGAPSFMAPHGAPADTEASLGWGVTIVAIVITLLVFGLLLLGLLRRRDYDTTPKHASNRSIVWIMVGGVLLPAVVLVVVTGFTMRTLHVVAEPAGNADVRVQVIAHRWWWEIKYLGATPDLMVVTANEMHIPVHGRVHVELIAADVIHSFWVPQLAGKMDVIPGQHNTTWLRADSAGIYRGECAEFCGAQHAHMDFMVVAEPPAAFANWLSGQRTVAAVPTDSLDLAGYNTFRVSACAACHTIRGADAFGKVGPELTHLASRRTIAAGMLPNTRGNLAAWIVNAQSIKPGVGMPALPMAAAQEQALLAYLSTLR
ncbi:MAG: cytochrome c oxidase subunit II [Gemmatimonadaceae bacterium]